LICPERPLDGLKVDRKDAMKYLDADLLKPTDIAHRLGVHAAACGPRFVHDRDGSRRRNPRIDRPRLALGREPPRSLPSCLAPADDPAVSSAVVMHAHGQPPCSGNTGERVVLQLP
jgi:hypothetical protein